MNSQQMYDNYQQFGDTFNQADNPWYNPSLLEKDYDWIDNGTQTGIVQDHNLIFTAGTEKTKTYICFFYHIFLIGLQWYDHLSLVFRFVYLEEKVGQSVIDGRTIADR